MNVLTPFEDELALLEEDVTPLDVELVVLEDKEVL